MKWLLLSLLLSGCATPYWTHVDPGYHAPVLMVRVAEQDMSRMCGGLTGENACAWRFPDACLVVLGPKADQCVLDHETRAHCKGWDHFTRQPYRNDCGDELPNEAVPR